jgi:CheY-like chemotaxis protein
VSEVDRRILVIDDNPAILDDFRKILRPRVPAGPPISLDASLFGTEEAQASRAAPFVVDTATQGDKGIELVEQMVRVRTPYALVFVDMRMPPGCDGVETLEGIWKVDPAIQGVICSAYFDYSWHEVIARLHAPGLRLLRKPFSTAEVLDLAWALTNKWLGRKVSSDSFINTTPRGQR